MYRRIAAQTMRPRKGRRSKLEPSRLEPWREGRQSRGSKPHVSRDKRRRDEWCLLAFHSSQGDQ